MRATFIGLVALSLVACGQAPVNPAPVQSAPPAAATQASPYPAPPAAPPPQVQPHAATAPAVPAAPPPSKEVPVDKDHREVLIHTNLGDMVVQLDAAQAPLTVKQFLTNAREHYFDGSGFYRVIPGFVIQAGDYTPDLDYRAPRLKPIPFEPSALTNQRGSIAMARDTDPNSANSTFFINLSDNSQQFALPDGKQRYAAFGQVVKGMDVVDKIGAVETHSVTLLSATAPYDDVPVKPVKILKVTLLPMPPAGKP